jgi:hypothetical protein
VEKSPRKVVKSVDGTPVGVAEASLYIRMLASSKQHSPRTGNSSW